MDEDADADADDDDDEEDEDEDGEDEEDEDGEDEEGEDDEDDEEEDDEELKDKELASISALLFSRTICLKFREHRENHLETGNQRNECSIELTLKIINRTKSNVKRRARTSRCIQNMQQAAI